MDQAKYRWILIFIFYKGKIFDRHVLRVESVKTDMVVLSTFRQKDLSFVECADFVVVVSRFKPIAIFRHLIDAVKEFPLLKCADVESFDRADSVSVPCLATEDIDIVAMEAALSSESLLARRWQAGLLV